MPYLSFQVTANELKILPPLIRLAADLQIICCNLNKNNSIIAVQEDKLGYGMARASCQILKLRDAHVPGMAGSAFMPLWVRGPDMHHDTCVTNVPWGITETLTNGFI